MLDALFMGVLSQSPSDAVASGNPKAAMFFYVICPVMNLYAILFAKKCAYEADDDVEREFVERERNLGVSQNFRNRVIWVLCLIIGLVMVPTIVWLFTRELAVLWGETGSFWSSGGHLASTAITVMLFLLVPNLFPGLLRFLDQLELRIGDKVSEFEAP